MGASLTPDTSPEKQWAAAEAAAHLLK